MKSLRLLVLLVSLFPSFAQGEPFAQVRNGNILITLHTEACVPLPVVNLLNRVEWVENGKTTEGCWNVDPRLAVVMAYFTDKTFVVIPVTAFSKVTDI